MAGKNNESPDMKETDVAKTPEEQEGKNSKKITALGKSSPEEIQASAKGTGENMMAELNRDIMLNSASKSPEERAQITGEMNQAQLRFNAYVQVAATAEKPEERERLLAEAIDAFAKDVGGLRGRINGSLADKVKQGQEQDQATLEKNQKAQQEFTDATKKSILEKMTDAVKIQEQENMKKERMKLCNRNIIAGSNENVEKNFNSACAIAFPGESK